MEIICYLSNGYPTLAQSREVAMAYAEAGCRIIEVDFPSRDPYLESELIAGRMKCALEACDDYRAYMKEIAGLKKALPKVQILILIYGNTLEEIGTDEFIGFCREHDFKDILLVGLTDESLKQQLMAADLQVSCYIQFHLPETEIASAKASNGFVYLQARPNLGQEVNVQYPTLADAVAYLRKSGITRPIYCGVGVHAPEDVTTVKAAGADAAFIGSTILKLWDDLPAMKQTIRDFKARC